MHRELGQASVLALGLALVTFAIAGLAVDGTRAFLYRRTLQNAADAAALAAAGEIDRARLYAGGGNLAPIDPIAARARAREWLALRGIAARAQIDAGPGGVRIVLAGSVATTFLGLVGVGSLPVAVESAAEPVEQGIP